LTYIKAILIAAVTLAFSIAVIIAMLVGDKKLFHPFARVWSKLLLVLSGVTVQTKYSEKYRSFVSENEKANVVFAANHSSFYDIPVILATAGRNANIVYKKSLEKTPVWGWGLRMSPFVAVDRQSGRDSMEAINKAIESIKQGDSVIVFPEGTRTKTGEIGDFKRGAFLIAARSGLPIVPVAIKGTFPLLSFKPFKITGGKIMIKYGEPYYIQGEGALAEKKAMSEVHNTISEMLENSES
jgi:1-acyl-sn-glycerol-3-phosphate acyltransferase